MEDVSTPKKECVHNSDQLDMDAAEPRNDSSPIQDADDVVIGRVILYSEACGGPPGDFQGQDVGCGFYFRWPLAFVWGSALVFIHIFEIRSFYSL